MRFTRTASLSGIILWIAASLTMVEGAAAMPRPIARAAESTVLSPKTPVLSEPAPPSLTPLETPLSSLSSSEINQDIQALNGLMKTHPGDGQVYGPDQLVYNIDARISPVLHEVSGRLQLHLHNNLNTPIRALYFNVWPDAPHYRRAGGYTTISDVFVDGAKETYALHGTLLQIALTHPLSPNQSAMVRFAFLSNLPNIDDRYGYEGTNINLGNGFPILAVHDDNGWNTPPYYTDGESFYSVTGAFHVNITAPKSLVIAATGQPYGPTTDDGQDLTTRHLKAIGVRDFAMVADPTYQVRTAQQGATTIAMYYTQREAPEVGAMMSAAKRAMTSYETLYGPYPYPSLRICAMKGQFGGMEYPQLVMISLDDTAISTTNASTTVAHEVAHQWFYGMVGDNQFLNPFMDESFATFAENRVDGTLSTLTNALPSVRHPSDPVFAFASSDFPQITSGDVGLDDYTIAVYNRGAKVLLQLMQLLGGTEFDKMMQEYVQQYQFQIATTADFVQFVSTFVGRDMTHFFSSRGVSPATILSAPTQPWVLAEEAENERGWH